MKPSSAAPWIPFCPCPPWPDPSSATPVENHLPGLGDDFVDLFDFALVEGKPLNAANAVCLPGLFENTVLPQPDRCAIAFRDHAQNFGLLLAQHREIFAGCRNHV